MYLGEVGLTCDGRDVWWLRRLCGPLQRCGPLSWVLPGVLSNITWLRLLVVYFCVVVFFVVGPVAGCAVVGFCIVRVCCMFQYVDSRLLSRFGGCLFGFVVIARCQFHGLLFAFVIALGDALQRSLQGG